MYEITKGCHATPVYAVDELLEQRVIKLVHLPPAKPSMGGGKFT